MDAGPAGGYCLALGRAMGAGLAPVRCEFGGDLFTGLAACVVFGTDEAQGLFAAFPAHHGRV